MENAIAAVRTLTSMGMTVVLAVENPEPELVEQLEAAGAAVVAGRSDGLAKDMLKTLLGGR